MNIYYIDYENVSSQGLKGIELLTENDEVNLLYSKKADNVKIDMLTVMMESKARIRFLPVHVGTPNALDFQLVTLLFLNYKENDHCYIISKDSGYDCCIKTAAENGAPNVSRYPNIESAVKGIPVKKTRRGRRTASEASNGTMVTSVKESVRNENRNNNSVKVDSKIAVDETPSPETVQDPQKAPSRKTASSRKVKPSQEALSSKDSVLSQDETASRNNASSKETTSPETSAPQDQILAAEDNAKKRTSRRRGRKKAISSENESSENTQKASEQPVDQPIEDQKKTDSKKAPEAEQEHQTKDHSDRHDTTAKEHSDHHDTAAKEHHDTSVNDNSEQHVLQQRYLSKQFEAKTSPADKAKTDADKPVSILSVIRRRNDIQLDMHQVDLIRNALNNSSNKQQFYSYFVKQLGQKQGIELYHSVKSSYTDLVNANLL